MPSLGTEVSALAVGYRSGDSIFQTLPPQPPISMAPIRPLLDEEVVQFTQQLDFIPLILAARQIACDDLVAAMLLRAAARRQPVERRSFLLEAGRICARYLAGDLSRLEYVLRMLNQPAPLSVAGKSA